MTDTCDPDYVAPTPTPSPTPNPTPSGPPGPPGRILYESDVMKITKGFFDSDMPFLVWYDDMLIMGVMMDSS